MKRIRIVLPLAAVAAALHSAAAHAQPREVRIVADQPALGAPNPYRQPAVSEFRLDNGLRVVVVTQPSLPLVTGRLIVDAGAEHEPAAHNGLAVLTANLIPEGTAALSGADLAAEMERIGAQFQTGAGQNLAFVSVTALKDAFAYALGLAGGAAMAANFPEREFQRVRQQAVSNYVATQSTVEGLGNETFMRALFQPGAPYARPAAGTAATLGALTRDDVVAWHRRMYVPGNATLLLVGDLSAGDARTIASGVFGGWRGETPRLPRPANPARPAERTRVVLVDRPGSVQSHIRIGVPSAGAEDPDVVRLQVLTHVLGGTFQARINQNLRERHGWTYGAFANFNPLRGAGVLLVNSSVRTNATDSAVAESVREFRRLVDEPIPAAELAGASGNLVGSFPTSVQTVQGLAQRMQNLLVWGLPLDYYGSYRERLAAVTEGDLATVGRARINPGALTVVVAGDLAHIEAPLRALDLGDVEVWSPAGERIR
jgi:zinc protease